MLIELSHVISEKNTIVPPNHPQAQLILRTEIKKGDLSNTAVIKMSTHSGTHIDAPFHFNPQGLSIDMIDLSSFIFVKPVVISCPKKERESISLKDLSHYSSKIKDCDLLMIYTGFEKYRQTNPYKYVHEAPTLSLEGAEYLIKNFTLKGIAIDLIGIENIDEGRKKGFPVHKVFFKHPSSPREFIIIEDVNLSKVVNRKIKKVYAIPLRIKGADGSPATVFAEVETLNQK